MMMRLRQPCAPIFRRISTPRQCLSSQTSDYLSLRSKFNKEIQELPECRALVQLEHFLQNANAEEHASPPVPPAHGYKHTMTCNQVDQTIQAMLATFCLHVEARIASLLGHGFYTIGPCGEEALSSAAHCLSPQDTLALHYRHTGINLCRQLASSNSEDVSLHDVLLDRARGYTVSAADPVTGGVHCSIGSDSPSDYIVTSTLASQCPSAVGRALAFSLVARASTKKRVSVVSLGDGSAHNAHFLSAFHLARHAAHKNIKCPVVFIISDNGLSISYNPQGYVDTMFGNDELVKSFVANGSDMMDVYSQTKEAVDYSRQYSAPCVIIYKGLVRRFGHAATDRQDAYLSQEEIQAMADTNVLEQTIVQAVEKCSNVTYGGVLQSLQEIQDGVLEAFIKASKEPKVTRQEMVDRVSAPLEPVSNLLPNVLDTHQDNGIKEASGSSSSKPHVMRKHMTRAIAECMEKDDSIVYLGEDVVHGGYYNVTEHLADQFPGRILDFPPDETSLLGAAMGFSQVGLLPIVEIPYAKYLDCGVDMWNEIAITYWLSAGKQPNGLILRLQGFDRGLFGGSFHTSNLLPHVPPGVDMVCYSNGQDYARGIRYAIRQAKAGRVVMFVDCTNLLNLRHLHGKDRAWETSYPAPDEMIGFDFIRRFGKDGSFAIVTYGNGVVTSLQARQALVDMGVLATKEPLDIIDCPYLSSVPDGLRSIIGQYERVLFADICKEGPGGNVLSSMVCALKQERLLPNQWELVSAPRTYNPLGSMETFLNKEDIVDSVKELINFHE